MTAIKGTAVLVGTIYVRADKIDRVCAELRAVVAKADNPAFRPVQFFMAAGHNSENAGHLAELV